MPICRLSLPSQSLLRKTGGLAMNFFCPFNLLLQHFKSSLTSHKFKITPASWMLVIYTFLELCGSSPVTYIMLFDHNHRDRQGRNHHPLLYTLPKRTLRPQVTPSHLSPFPQGGPVSLLKKVTYGSKILCQSRH